jgi:ATP-dependent Lhr-like helicase
MRLAGSGGSSGKPGTKIGELDEEFVFERKVGEVFSLGAQAWKIVDIGGEAVTVAPANAELDIVPFWKGDAVFRSPEVSSRALALLDKLDELDEEQGAALLKDEYGFSESAAELCSRFVAAQKAAGLGRVSLPKTNRLVLEVNEDHSAKARTLRLILHTLRGLAVNAPLAMALAALIEEESGLPVWDVADDDRVLVALPRDEDSDVVTIFSHAFSKLTREGELERRARSRIEASGFFGSQFRQNACRALLLPRGLPGRRVPLWLTRLRAKKLFEAVRSLPDFPVTVETWRSCMADLLDLDGARRLISGVAEGSIELSVFPSRAPSPFAREALWRETGAFMYADDSVAGKASSSVSDRVVAEALRSARLRPRLERSLVEEVDARLKRLVPGWAPADPLSFVEWVKERVFLPVSEYEALIDSAGAIVAETRAADPGFGGRIKRLRLANATEDIIVHAEREAALAADPASCLPEWLRRETLVPPDRISALLGLSEALLDDLLDDLVEDGIVVVDAFVEDSDQICVVDAQNLEILLRRSRRAARKIVETRPGGDLVRMIAALHGLGGTRQLSAAIDDLVGETRDAALDRALTRLSGYPAPAGLWETELLPARVLGYAPGRLDDATAGLHSISPWQWIGTGRACLTFCRPEDIELFVEPGRTVSRIVPSGSSALDFWALREAARPAGVPAEDSAAFARELWAEAWKGLIASDDFNSIRGGLSDDFGAHLTPGGESDSDEAHPFGLRRRIPRALRDRWRGGPPVAGRWFRLELEDRGDIEEYDELDLDALDAARARILASRYGLVCRDLLDRELPALRWGRIFPALRRLELAGELYSGRFFDGVDGPQFLDPAAYQLFLSLDDLEQAPFWINALDPIASALYALSPRNDLLPARTSTAAICVFGGRIVAVSTRSYRELTIAVDPAEPALDAILSLFPAVRSRAVRPERRIVLETVNGGPAARSSFAEALRACGFESDRGRLVMW